jgi:cyclopropane-fatty-acyl-phospholipid synthase
MHTIDHCGISDSREFHSLWKLPRLPLTERFGPFRPDHDDLAFDQELVISLPTGHVQLRRQLDPRVLYTSTDYSFRTSVSKTARQGTAFFIDFLKRAAAGRDFSSLVDVGGNDFFLARELAGYTGHRAVIDPICAAQDGQTVDGIQVIGRFIEQVDLSRDLPRPDLVVCRHTLEHIAQPRAVINQWFKQCDPDCLYLAEIPCFENLVEAQRFDAVFHQHFHYYDLASFKHLIWRCGGEYLGHAVNHQGSCGGALLVAFRRAKTVQPKPLLDLPARIAWLEKRIARYREQMAIMGELLGALPKPVYGYGASLMLSTLGYHLKTDFSALECVLDDDATRDDTTYENVPVTVRHTAKIAPAPNSSYLITSLENVRPIYRRILELTPRRILVPQIN